MVECVSTFRPQRTAFHLQLGRTTKPGSGSRQGAEQYRAAFDIPLVERSHAVHLLEIGGSEAERSLEMLAEAGWLIPEL